MNGSRLVSVVWVASFLTAIGASLAPPLVACATVSEADIPAPIYIQSESAVIIWDSTNHVEHFIRQASMNVNAPDLGFLVPTPETPELAEADPRIFDLASTIGSPTKIPPAVVQTPWQILEPLVTNPTLPTALEGGTAPIFGLPGVGKPAQPVLSDAFVEHDVAGYRALTLDPKDTEAVMGWLKQNGYASTPALQAWLKRYADAGWEITAFHLVKTQPADSSLTTRAIRLSFHTEHPYYPYSEPADRQQASAASPGGRVLHVAVLSDRPMTGAKADASTWPGQLLYAGPSTGAGTDAHEWLNYAKLDDGVHSVSPMTELTTFLDNANPRQGTADLYFTKAARTTPFRAMIIDPTQPTVRQIDWSNSLADAAALFAFILIPGVPIYGGWRAFTGIRAAWARQPLARAAQSSHPVQTKRKMNKITGFFAIAWGLFYGMWLMRLMVLWLFGLAGSLLQAGHPTPQWVTTLVIGIPVIIAAAAMVWSVTYCGLQAWRSRAGLTQPDHAGEPAQLRRRFQETLALAAMFAGAIGLALMVYAVFHTGA